MTEAEPHAGERVVEVSREALARIFPEAGMSGPGPRGGRLGGLATSGRVRLRLIWTRLRFRLDDFQGMRCRWAGIRLRVRLLWMRLRHRGRLPR